MQSTLGEIDVRLLVPLVGALVAFIFWVLQRLWEYVVRVRDGRKAADNFIRALFAEIDFNTRDMEVFERNSASPAAIRTAIEQDTARIPHITDARHTEIYRTRIGDIHEIPDSILQQTVEFYGLLEKIRVQIEAVNYPSYRTLSTNGKLQAIAVIRDTVSEARWVGEALLTAFMWDSPQLGLRRMKRRDATALQEAELEALKTDVAERIEAARARQIR